MSSQESLRYYETNAAQFISDTAHVDMAALYERFLPAIPAGGLILDAGCGLGRHIWQVCKFNSGTSIAFDLDATSLQSARFVLDQMDQKGETVGLYHLVSGSVTQLPFNDATFDKVICSEVLEHVPDDRF